MTVDSSGRVENLNADLLDGMNASAFAPASLEARVAELEAAVAGDMWAKIDADAGAAAVLHGSGVVSAASVAPGIFSVTFSNSVVGCGWVATRNDNLDGVSIAGEVAIELGSSIDPTTLWVRTFDSAGAPADPSPSDGFTIQVDC